MPEQSEPGSLETKGLRVAYICTDPGVPIFGQKGASVHVQEFVGGLARLGAKVKLFSSSIRSRESLESDGVEVHDLPNWPRGNSSDAELSLESSNQSLRSELKKGEPLDLVYERYSLWSYAGMEYAKSMRVPGLLEVNAPLIEEEVKYRGLKNIQVPEQVARRAFQASSQIIAVSDGVANYLSRFEETTGKVHVVHNGVNPERFPADLEPSMPAHPGVFTVGFLGSLKTWHGLETLAEAYSLFHREAPHTRLLIVGDGPQKETLAKTLAAKGLTDSSEFTGAVNPSEVPALVASMDVGVAPYPDLEGFYFSPLKILEYMAAGRPVVASKVGDISAMVEDGVEGFLVAPGDPTALKDALHKLISDRQLCVALGSAAREKVLRSHTWEMVIKRVLDTINVAAGPNSV